MVVCSPSTHGEKVRHSALIMASAKRQTKRREERALEREAGGLLDGTKLFTSLIRVRSKAHTQYVSSVVPMLHSSTSSVESNHRWEETRW